METYLYMEAEMEKMQISLIPENELNSYKYINRGCENVRKMS